MFLLKVPGKDYLLGTREQGCFYKLEADDFGGGWGGTGKASGHPGCILIEF